MNSALTRYRVLAYVVGVLLVVLVFVAVPLQLAGQPFLARYLGMLHGFLYMAYLVAGFDLARRQRWPLGPTLVVLLAGTVPFLTFVVEHRVTHRWMRVPAEDAA